MNDERLLTIKEVCKATKLHRDTVSSSLRSGVLKGRNIGGSRGWVTTWSAVREWIESGNASAATAAEEEQSHDEGGET
jgi:predicted DNA-binding transcriptional regulator AlpA